MDAIRVVSDPDECRQIWRQVIPVGLVSDLWEFRACFMQHFHRQPYFIVVEKAGRILGLLPLTWIRENGYYGYFPGEVWNGQTWLEQNRIFAASEGVLRLMVEFLHSSRIPYHLRYLLPFKAGSMFHAQIDETGYLFHPPRHDYSMDNYFALFSGKSQKQIKKELAVFEARGIEYRFDDLEDFDLMVRMNQERFGNCSYFADPRFVDSFRDLMIFMHSNGWLRMVTILVGGQPAAVDMGCVYNNTYTLFTGGTSEAFPGIAKAINLFHMQRACNERFRQVDFLCGDFSWKHRFHLTPRPLYLFSSLKTDAAAYEPVVTGMQAAEPTRIRRGIETNVH